MKGLFITFEGPEGSGKSTIIKKVNEILTQKIHDYKIILTREPGGTNNPLAEHIRQIILQQSTYKITDRTELLLFAASRAQHTYDVIEPNLLRGNIVLCDRFIHSSIAYQGYARSLDIQKITDISVFASNNIHPDLTFFLMIRPEEGLKRINANALRDFNRLDNESISMHEKVYDGYKKILATKQPSFVEIDASQSIDEVLSNVMEHIYILIRKHYGIKIIN